MQYDLAFHRGQTLDPATRARPLPVLTTLSYRGVSYNEDGKRAFHREARRALRNLADALGYDRGDCKVRNFYGSPAVSGEVTLQSAEVYIRITCNGQRGDVLYRHRSGRGAAGANHYAQMNALANSGALAARICADLGLSVPELATRLAA